MPNHNLIAARNALEFITLQDVNRDVGPDTHKAADAKFALEFTDIWTFIDDC